MYCHLNFLPVRPEMLLHDILNGNPGTNRRPSLMSDKQLKINALTGHGEYQNGKSRPDVGKSDNDCRIFRQPDWIRDMLINGPEENRWRSGRLRQ
jgi:hypothetical protein